MSGKPTTTAQDAPRSEADGGALLALNDLSVELQMRRRKVRAVNGVSLEVAKRETLGIVGESGSGKTMMALAIMRLLPAPFGKIVNGAISFAGRDLASETESEMRRIRGDRISMIFQEPMTALDPLFTIGSQIVEAIHAHRRIGKEEAKRLAVAMLERVHIPSAESRFGNFPHEMSGGMRQRVMIAMALCLRPELLLADEPTTALDVTVQAQILELIEELKAELEMGVMLITHNLAVVRDVADRVAVMYAGEIVEIGDTADVFATPCHPYTQGLLRSIPTHERVARLHVISGRPPDLTRELQGCPFRARCTRAVERCATTHPPLDPTEGVSDHRVRCWNPVQGL